MIRIDVGSFGCVVCHFGSLLSSSSYLVLTYSSSFSSSIHSSHSPSLSLALLLAKDAHLINMHLQLRRRWGRRRQAADEVNKSADEGRESERGRVREWLVTRVRERGRREGTEEPYTARQAGGQACVFCGRPPRRRG